MKKVLLTLSIFIYIIVGYYNFNGFTHDSYNDMFSKNYKKVLVSAWSGECSVEKKLEQIEAFAKENNINIWKLGYESSENNDVQTCSLFCAIGNIDEFNKKMNSSFRCKSELSEFNQGEFLANRKLSSNKQIEMIHPFYNHGLIKVMSIKDSDSVLGEYLFNADHGLCEEFISKMGFNQFESSGGGSESGVFVAIILLLILFLLLYIVSYVYHFIENYKKIAIYKSLGWENFDITKLLVFKEILVINVVGCLFANLVLSIFVLLYNHGNQFCEFMLKCLKNDLWIMGLILLISCIIFSFSKYIDIKLMVKNKRPVKLVQIIQGSLKFILVITISILSIYSFDSIFMDGIRARNEAKKLKDINHYMTYNFNSIYAFEKSKITSDISQKCQKLFNLENQHNCVVAYKSILYYRKPRSKEEMNKKFDSMYINAEYLKHNAVYDLNGKRISLDPEYGNRITVLIPEKYRKDESKLGDMINEWYESQIWLEGYNSEVNNNYIPQKLDLNNIEKIYVKNVQNLFTYNIDSMSVNEPILFVVNSANVSKELFLTLFLTHSVYVNPGATDDVKSYLQCNLSKCNLSQEVLSIESVSHRYNFRLHEMEEYMRYVYIIFAVFLISIVALIFFSVVNYSERNKLIIAIKKLHGYSFITRYRSYFIKDICMYIIICTLLAAPQKFLEQYMKNYLSFVLLLMASLCVFDLVMSTIFIKMTEKKKIYDITKGE